MKRLFYILLPILFVVSCAIDDTFSDGANSGLNDGSITFSTVVDASKASESTIDSLYKQGFFVSAYLDKTEYDFSHYFNAFVEHDGGWKSDNNQFWPSSGFITFDGYSYNKEIIEKGAGELTQAGRSLSYVCAPELNEQIDLLAISAQVPNKEIANLKFKHALSQIRFMVDFTSSEEKNITLTKINIIYHNITSEGDYIFGSDGDKNGSTSGDGSWSLGETTFGNGLYATAIETDLTEKGSLGDDMIFDVPNAMMIIPQPIVITESDTDTDKYISVSVEYTLNSGDNSGKITTTGTMELPAPDDSNSYQMGKCCTYVLAINGETISVDVSIEDGEKPSFAYGNIDLRLITDPITHTEYENIISGSNNEIPSSEKPHLYNTTAVRVSRLLADGVRDFVAVGDFGANAGGEHDGKLGYYGSDSSPFYMAADDLDMMPDFEFVTEDSVTNKVFDTPNSDYLFSIDLRGVYNFPTFGSVHSSASGDNNLKPSAQILTPGIFKDLALLDEVIFPHGLVAIGEYAFQNCPSLTRVDLAGVKHIEEGAFVDCINLVEVVGDSLTRIHAYGFDDCVKLEKINLTNVTEIDQFGFVNCTSLSNVNLENLDIIDDHAFDGCSMLTVEKGTIIPEFKTVANFAFSGCSSLGTNGGNINLDGATRVGKHAFHSCTQILLSSGNLNILKYIGDYAFANCEQVGSKYTIHLPLIDTIGASAFEGCGYINIVEGLDRLKDIFPSTFQGCSSLNGGANGLDFPLVDSVGSLAFTNSGITTINFSNNLKYIGDYAFNNCKSLTEISGLDKVEEIGSYAFAGSDQIKELNLIGADTVGAEFIAGCPNLETLIMPKIKRDSFYDVKTGKVIDTLPPIIDLVRQSADDLKNVNIENLEVGRFASWTSWSENNSLETINIASCDTLGGAAFAYCRVLKEVVATKAIQVEDNAFDGCTLLETIDLSGAENLGGAVFSNCPALENLKLSSLVTPLGIWSFQDYKNLRYVDISSISSIGNGTFAGCSALEIVDASSATDLGVQCFAWCSSLKELNLSGITKELTFESGFEPFCASITTGCKLYLNSAQSSYVSGNVWCNTEWGEIIFVD